MRHNIPQWALSEHLRYFCGLVAVGTNSGHVLLVGKNYFPLFNCKPITCLSELRYFCGLVAVGTNSGHVLLVGKNYFPLFNCKPITCLSKHLRYFCGLVCFCCFTSHVNSYGHCRTVSSLNHTFSWAGLSKRLTSNLCTYFRL